MNNFNGRRVELREGEDINRALRKFKNKVEDSGIMDELRKREFFEKPTTRQLSPRPVSLYCSRMFPLINASSIL